MKSLILILSLTLCSISFGDVESRSDIPGTKVACCSNWFKPTPTPAPGGNNVEACYAGCGMEFNRCTRTRDRLECQGEKETCMAGCRTRQ